MQLSVSVHAASGMLAVGYGEPAAVLPREVRVLEFEVGELVAAALATQLATAAVSDRRAASIDLDELVESAERVLAARTHREDRPHRRGGLPVLAVATNKTAPRARSVRSRRIWPAGRAPRPR